MDAGKLAWRRGGPGSPTANPAVPGRKRRSRGRPTPQCRVARHSLEPTQTPRWHLDQGPVRGRRPFSPRTHGFGGRHLAREGELCSWALGDLPIWVPAPRGRGTARDSRLAPHAGGRAGGPQRLGASWGCSGDHLAQVPGARTLLIVHRATTHWSLRLQIEPRVA